MAFTCAAIQMQMHRTDTSVNIATAERLVRQAASSGANIILIPELFESRYFCIEQVKKNLHNLWAHIKHHDNAPLNELLLNSDLCFCAAG